MNSDHSFPSETNLEIVVRLANDLAAAMQRLRREGNEHDEEEMRPRLTALLELRDYYSYWLERLS